MTSESVPEETCAVAGCGEDAVVTPRAPVTDALVDRADGEIVPLCAVHAEQADAPEVPPLG